MFGDDMAKIVYAILKQVAIARFQLQSSCVEPLQYFLQVFEVLLCVSAIDDDVIQIY